MPLYRYSCPAGHESELLRPRTVEMVPCACGETAYRQAVYSIGVSGFAPVPRDQVSHRQGFREFTEARDEVGYHYDRAIANGDTERHPDLLAAAKERVNGR